MSSERGNVAKWTFSVLLIAAGRIVFSVGMIGMTGVGRRGTCTNHI